MSHAYTIGFTGTRNGMTPPQRASVRQVLLHHLVSNPGTSMRALHGDCVGADADFHALAREQGIEVCCRPCTFDGMRARSGAPELAPPKPPMQRNRDIVADADLMIACPPNHTPIKRGSGTWATIGFAQRAGKPLTIVFPDGSFTCSFGR